MHVSSPHQLSAPATGAGTPPPPPAPQQQLQQRAGSDGSAAGRYRHQPYSLAPGGSMRGGGGAGGGMAAVLGLSSSSTTSSLFPPMNPFSPRWFNPNSARTTATASSAGSSGWACGPARRHGDLPSAPSSAFNTTTSTASSAGNGAEVTCSASDTSTLLMTTTAGSSGRPSANLGASADVEDGPSTPPAHRPHHHAMVARCRRPSPLPLAPLPEEGCCDDDHYGYAHGYAHGGGHHYAPHDHYGGGGAYPPHRHAEGHHHQQYSSSVGYYYPSSEPCYHDGLPAPYYYSPSPSCACCEPQYRGYPPSHPPHHPYGHEHYHGHHHDPHYHHRSAMQHQASQFARRGRGHPPRTHLCVAPAGHAYNVAGEGDEEDVDEEELSQRRQHRTQWEVNSLQEQLRALKAQLLQQHTQRSSSSSVPAAGAPSPSHPPRTPPHQMIPLVTATDGISPIVPAAVAMSAPPSPAPIVCEAKAAGAAARTVLLSPEDAFPFAPFTVVEEEEEAAEGPTAAAPCPSRQYALFPAADGDAEAPPLPGTATGTVSVRVPYYPYESLPAWSPPAAIVAAAEAAQAERRRAEDEERARRTGQAGGAGLPRPSIAAIYQQPSKASPPNVNAPPPPTAADPLDLRPYMTEAGRCVKVGGVIDSTTPAALSALIAAVFGVAIIGAAKKGTGMFLLVLADFEADYPRLKALDESLWMGPTAALLAADGRAKAYLEGTLLAGLKAVDGKASFPRHTMTFAPWVPAATHRPNKRASNSGTAGTAAAASPSARSAPPPPPASPPPPRYVDLTAVAPPPLTIRVGGVELPPTPPLRHPAAATYPPAATSSSSAPLQVVVGNGGALRGSKAGGPSSADGGSGPLPSASSAAATADLIRRMMAASSG